MLKKKQKQSWSIGTTMCYIYLSFFIHKFQLNLCDSLSSSTINCVINIIKHYSCHQNMVPFHLYAASTTTINQVYHETLLMSSIHLQKNALHSFVDPSVVRLSKISWSTIHLSGFLSSSTINRSIVQNIKEHYSFMWLFISKRYSCHPYGFISFLCINKYC